MSNLKGGNFLAVDTDPKEVFIWEDLSEEQMMIADCRGKMQVSAMAQREQKEKV